MRHKVAGYKLGRNTSHRRSLLRNLVTSVIVEERVETTVPKAKAAKPLVEKMITLGKRGDLAARRLAAAYLMTDAAVVKLFDTIGPRFGDRNGGYLRIVRTGWNKGDGADKAFLELLGSEKVLDEKREKRAEARAKKAAETRKAMEDAEAQAQHDGGVEPVKEEKEDKKRVAVHVERARSCRAFLFADRRRARVPCPTRPQYMSSRGPRW
jgi:large subunit ribosomal protein L17